MTTLYSYLKYNITFGGVLMVLLGIAAGWLGIWIWTTHKFYKKPRIAACIACAVAFIGLTFILPSITCEKHYILECTIDESYSAVKLYDTYKVIDKRGDIWVIEKRPGVSEDAESE